MHMANSTICLIIFGSFFFLVAAFLPISRVFMQTTLDAKLAMIKKSPITWSITQIVFSISSLAVAIGFILRAAEMDGNDHQIMAWMLGVAVDLMICGSYYTRGGHLIHDANSVRCRVVVFVCFVILCFSVTKFLGEIGTTALACACADGNAIAHRLARL